MQNEKTAFTVNNDFYKGVKQLIAYGNRAQNLLRVKDSIVYIASDLEKINDDEAQEAICLLTDVLNFVKAIPPENFSKEEN